MTYAKPLLAKLYITTQFGEFEAVKGFIYGIYPDAKLLPYNAPEIGFGYRGLIVDFMSQYKSEDLMRKIRNRACF